MRSLARATIAAGLGGINRSLSPYDHALRTWPTDAAVPLLLRAVGSLAMTTNTEALAIVAQAFLTALVPQSAGAELLSRGLALHFGNAAHIDVPGIGLPSADFVAEGAAIPVTAPSPTGVQLSRHKIAVIATATSELLRNPSAEDLIRQTLIEATGPALDRAMFSALPATDEHPAGLLNGITPTPAPAGDIIDILAALVGSVAPVAGNGGIAIVAAPTQAVAINLRLARQPPYVVLASSTLPPGTIICVALNGLVSAVEGPPEIDASTDALVHEETGPSVNIGGGVMAHPLRSFFQSDTVGLRLRWSLSWALRDPRAIAWLQ
jgi:hypothetical protein